MLARPKKSNKYPVALTLLLILFLFLTSHTNHQNILLVNIFADDKCKDIEDDSDRMDCYEKKEAETQAKLTSTRNLLDSTINNINQLSSQLNVTQAELNEVQQNVNEIKSQLDEINQNLADRNQKLSDKIEVRNTLLRNYSKKNILNELELFFTENENNFSGFQISTYVYAFNKAANQDTLKMIAALNSEIQGFENDKKSAEDLKTKLETAQANLLSLTNDLAARKATEQAQANELSAKEDKYEKELDELQNKILSLKYSDENGSVGDYEQPSSKTPSAPFKPAFAAFSYGAYTHGNGMSQYGAKGRADSGQDYKAILKFYYKVDLTSVKKDNEAKISVQGYGEMSYQKYLYGIAEMPSSWDSDALKAQAIAARTYAYRSAKPICVTQSCQVFLKSKADNPPASWKKAVDDTSGKILKDPKTSQYSSTTGGYINNIGWDVKGDWPGDAYEKKAGSPWFYKAWYTKSYNDNSTCGHPHPWLKSSEMADILNAWVVYTKGTSGEKGHISPLTTSCWGGDPYSMDKMGDVAEKYISNRYESVSSVDVDISNGGYTSRVILKTNNGNVSVDGGVFKTVFNLRAPGYVSIKNTLYDLVKVD